ncbi:MAG: rod shape-determining protein MreC [Xanthomonadales bacterium]|nr:rod shape-determining protein MreC [Xanthomonadales bacterium]
MTPSGSTWPAAIDGDAAARIARLMFYGLLAIVLMTLDYREGYVDSLRTQAWRAIEPVILAVEAPFKMGQRLGEELRQRHALMDRVAILERERRERLAELSLLEELRDDNRELRDLLDASQRLVPDFQSAELMNIDLNPWSHRVLINRGSRDGLEAGQPVMDAFGVMGQIDDVAFNTAQVILISDPDHALPVRVQRTGLRTVAYGSGRINQLRLTDLPMNVDLQPGDILVTSGLGGAFSAGLPVAEVESVSRPVGEAFAKAVVRPIARLDRARHVLVVSSPEVEADDDTDADADATPAAVEGDEHTEPAPEAGEQTPTGEMP